MDIIEGKDKIARLKEENIMLHRLLEVSKPVMEFGYTNWRIEHSVRRVFSTRFCSVRLNGVQSLVIFLREKKRQRVRSVYSQLLISIV